MNTAIALILLTIPAGEQYASIDAFEPAKTVVHSYTIGDAAGQYTAKQAASNCERLRRAFATNRENAACVTLTGEGQ